MNQFEFFSQLGFLSQPGVFSHFTGIHHFGIDWSELSLQVMITFAHFLWQACVIGFVLHVAESLRDSKILQRTTSVRDSQPIRDLQVAGNTRIVQETKSVRDSRTGRVSQGNKKCVSLGETDLRGANSRYAIACIAFFSLPICVIATFAWVHHSRAAIVMVATSPKESLSTQVTVAQKAISTTANRVLLFCQRQQ